MKDTRRLRAPILAIVLGLGATVAVGVGGGWGAAVPVAVIAVAGAVGYYIWGGRDSDTGAMFGSRPDERQSMLRMRAQALAGVACGITAVVGTMVATALKDPIWPFALFACVEAAAFVAGLVIFGSRGAS